MADVSGLKWSELKIARLIKLDQTLQQLPFNATEIALINASNTQNTQFLFFNWLGSFQIKLIINKRLKRNKFSPNPSL